MNSVSAQVQVEGLYRKALEMLHDYQGEHHRNFDGELHFHTADFQLIVDEGEHRRAQDENRLPVKHVVKHGETGTIFGTRCVADVQTPMGCVGLDEP